MNPEPRRFLITTDGYLESLLRCRHVFFVETVDDVRNAVDLWAAALDYNWVRDSLAVDFEKHTVKFIEDHAEPAYWRTFHLHEIKKP